MTLQDGTDKEKHIQHHWLIMQYFKRISNNAFNTLHVDIKYTDDRVQAPLVYTAPAPGGRLNKKDGLTRYGNFHVKDKTS